MANPKPATPKNVQEAFRKTCFDYRGGVQDMADALGMTPGVLFNKCNPADGHHKPTLADAMAVQQVSGSREVVCAMARSLDGVFIDLRNVCRSSDSDLVALISKWMADQGDFFTTLNASISDGQVTTSEAEAVKLRADMVASAMYELSARIRSMAR